MITIDEVKGLAELDKFLETLPEELQRSMLYSALMTAAKPIMDQAKANVQRQFGGSMRWTGTLMTGVTRGRMKKTGLAARVDVKLKRPRGAGPTVINGVRKKYGTDPFYGRYLEMGTSRMAPQPWLRPAADAKQGEAGEKMNAALQKQALKWCKANGVTYEPST